MTKVVGVIGGMGPAATLDFLVKLHHATGATKESEHLRVITDNNPRHADRNAAMNATGPSPAPLLAQTARGLAAAGAEVLAMPCNAANSWAAEIVAATPLPFVSMIDAAVAAVRAAVPGAHTVGLLAVEATQVSGIYHRGFADAGIEVIAPDMAAFMPLIYAVKRGDTGRQALGRFSRSDLSVIAPAPCAARGAPAQGRERRGTRRARLRCRCRLRRR